MKGILTILGGLGLGAAAMYLLDPNGGRRRRALIRDKAVGLSNDLRQTVEARSRDLGNRAKGLLHEAKSAMPGTASGSDERTEGTV
jgi:hypothetical protein